MKTIKLLVTAVLAAFVGLLLATRPANAWYLDRNLEEGEYILNNIAAGMVVYNTTREELFDLMTDLTTDPLFYDGVGPTWLASGDGGKGSVYMQTSFLFGDPIVYPIYVLKKNRPHDFVIYGKISGIFGFLGFEYVTTYKYQPRTDGSVEYVSYHDVITNIPGLTGEFFKFYLDTADQRILDYLGKTGVITQDPPPRSETAPEEDLPVSSYFQ